MKLSPIIPDRHRATIDAHLPPNLRITARGTYSDSIPNIGAAPPNSATHTTEQWLTPGNTNFRPFNISSDTNAGFLFVNRDEGRLCILTATTVVAPSDPTKTPYVIANLGDSLGSLIPVKAPLRSVMGNVISLASNEYAMAHPTLTCAQPLTNPIQVDEHAYNFPEIPVYPTDPTEAHLSFIPVTLPLPPKHGIKSGLLLTDPHYSEKIPLLGTAAAIWLEGMKYLQTQYDGKSLQAAIPNPAIVQHLESILPNTTLPILDSIQLEVFPLDATGDDAQRITERLRPIAHKNFDNFLMSNSDLLHNQIPNLQAILHQADPDHPHPPPSTAPMESTETKARFGESSIIHRLLVTKPPSDTIPKYQIPPTVSPLMAHILRADKIGTATHRLRKTCDAFSSGAKNGDPTYLNHSMNLPSQLMTPALSTAVLHGYYHEGYLHQQSPHQLKTMISVTTFRAADENDPANSSLISMTNRLLNEINVDEIAQHSSPISQSSIFQDGFCEVQNHLVQTIANHVAWFSIIDSGSTHGLLDKTIPHPIVITVLVELFKKVTSTDFSNWMTSMIPQAPYLILSFENEVHNILRILYKFATDPTNINHIREEKADQINYGPLDEFVNQATQLHGRIDSTVSSGSLGNYIAPPKQYSDMMDKKRRAAPPPRSGPRRNQDPQGFREPDGYPPMKKGSPTAQRPSDPRKKDSSCFPPAQQVTSLRPQRLVPTKLSSVLLTRS